MTVAALPAVVTYLEDGLTTSFPVPYRFRAAADLVVERVLGDVVLPLTLDVDYSVTGGQTDAGGTVTRGAVTNGAMLRIRRRTARAQPMAYTTGDRFPARSHEEALDRAVLIAQEQDASIDDLDTRSLKAPIGESLSPLPPASARAGRLLGFGTSGDPMSVAAGVAEVTADMLALRTAAASDREQVAADKASVIVARDQTLQGSAVAELAGDRAEAAYTATLANAVLQPGLYADVGSGLAATADGATFAVVAGDDLSAVSFYRKVGGAAVALPGVSLLSSSSFVSLPFSGPNRPVYFEMDATGFFISVQRENDRPLPASFGEFDVLATLASGEQVLPIGTLQPLYLSPDGISNGVPAGAAGGAPFGRIPLLVVIPSGRAFFFYQGRDGRTDYSNSSIRMRVCDDLGADVPLWSAERVILSQPNSASPHVDNLGVCYDPVTGRLECLCTWTPAGIAEATVVDPSTDASKATLCYSFYCPDPDAAVNALQFCNQNGQVLPAGAGPESLTLEIDARDPGKPYWNVGPGQQGIYNPAIDAVMLAGNASGVQGIPGAGSIAATGFGFLFYRVRGAAVGRQWKWKGATPLGFGVNESFISQAKSGKLVLDSRNHAGSAGGTVDKYRTVTIYADATGDTVERTYLDKTRPDSRVEGSGVRLAGGYLKPGLSIEVFANNAENSVQGGSNRKRLTFYVTVTDGEGFSAKLLAFPEPYVHKTDVLGSPLLVPQTVSYRPTNYSAQCRISGTTLYFAVETEGYWPNGTPTGELRIIMGGKVNLANILDRGVLL